MKLEVKKIRLLSIGIKVMRTILDQVNEVSLVSLIDQDINLICVFAPTTLDARRNVVVDKSRQNFQLVFSHVAGYLVLPEIAQIGMNFTYIDGFLVSEVNGSSALKFFGFNDYFPHEKLRHLTVRTSHHFINIFAEADAEISLLEN